MGYRQQKLHGSAWDRAAFFLVGDIILRYPDFLRIFVIDERLTRRCSQRVVQRYVYDVEATERTGGAPARRHSARVVSYGVVLP